MTIKPDLSVVPETAGLLTEINIRAETNEGEMPPWTSSPTADRTMSDESLSEADTSEETRCRRWARENYVPLPERSLSWPLFVLDEMRRLDAPDAIKPPKLLLRIGTLQQP